MENSSNFLIHLVSESTGSKNKAEFETTLQSPIYLPYNHEMVVALSSISYPTPVTTYNIKKNSKLAIRIPRYSKDRWYEINIPQANYSPQSLVYTINKRIKLNFGITFNKKSCFFVYNRDRDRIECYLEGGDDIPEPNKVTVDVQNPLAYTLGYVKTHTEGNMYIGSPIPLADPKVEVKKDLRSHAIGAYSPVLNQTSLIFVYLDCIQKQVCALTIIFIYYVMK